MYEKAGWKIALVIFVLGMCIYFAFPPLDGMVPGMEGKLNLGYDLKGGTLIELEVDDPSQRDIVKDVLEKRSDEYGLKQLQIEAVGKRRIQILAPGEMSEEIDAIFSEGVLELKQEARPPVREQYAKDIQDHRNSGKQGFPEPPDGYEVYDTSEAEGAGYVLVEEAPLVTGASFKRFYQTSDRQGQPVVGFDLYDREAVRFGEVTEELSSWDPKGRLAIIVNGKLESAPNVQTGIESGSGIVSFGGSRSVSEKIIEQRKLLISLKSGSLPVKPKVLSRLSTSPTLGAESVENGTKAIMIGVIVVLLFILIYYWGAGLVANFAMVLNLIILLGVLCAFNATFSLLGIAGLVLTVGMSIDANILVFERIREEKMAGKALRGAMNAGYKRAFRTIVDANVTTIGTALILLAMGTGPIRAFAITLSVGIAASMFTSLFVTRVIFTLLIRGQFFRHAKMMQLFQKPRIKFLKAGGYARIISIAAIVLGVGFFISRGSENFGIDFRGGVQYRLNIASNLSVAEIKEKLSALNPGGVAPEVRKGKGAVGSEITLRYSQDVLETIDGAGGEAEHLSKGVEAMIVKAFKDDFPPTPLIEDWQNNIFSRLTLRMTYNGTDASTVELRLKSTLRDMKVVVDDRRIEIKESDVKPVEIDRLAEGEKPYFVITLQCRYRGADAEPIAEIIGEQLTKRIEDYKPEFNIITDYQADNDAVVHIVLNLQVPDNLEPDLYDGYARAVVDRIKMVAPDKYQVGAGDFFVGIGDEIPKYDVITTDSGLRFMSIPLDISNDTTKDTFRDIFRKSKEALTGDKFLKSGDKKATLEIIGDPSGQEYTLALSPGGIASMEEFKPKVARELRGEAFKAIVLALIFIVLYIWFRFRKLSFGVGAVVALVHDVLIALGAVALFDSMSWFDVKFDLPIVAAILTVIGYSLNDTIVVFDRIRENMSLHRDERYYEENINNSINQTLGRTILTSATTFFVVFALALLGGETLRGFAIVLCVGVVVGTYSSIFIASPIVAWFHRRELKRATPSFAASKRAAEAR